MTVSDAQRSDAERDRRSVARLTEMADYVIPFALRAACDLGIPDHLAAGPLPVEEIAERSGTHARSLLRLLRALACRGVFTEVEPRTFAMTPLAEPLRSDHPRSLREAYPLLPGDARAWGELAHSLRTGRSAFERAHGTDYWSYLEAAPEDSARFDASQRAVTRRETRALLSAYDWAAAGTVVDVGGGNGAFLAALLSAFPHLRGVLLDQPHVVARAEAVFAAQGVADRASAVGGDFCSAVPEGGDLYTVKRAFYDLDDDDAAALLEAVRAVIPVHGRLLVIEPVPEPGDAFDWGKLYDLLLLTMRGAGGREESELSKLFDAAGFELVRVVRTDGLPIVEARPR